MGKVFVTSFYMGKFNGKTPKRHKLWGNDQRLLRLVNTQAGYMSRAEQSKCPGQTVRKYIDRNGKKRHVGIKGALTDSQYFVVISNECFVFRFFSTSPQNPIQINTYSDEPAGTKALYQGVWRVHCKMHF